MKKKQITLANHAIDEVKYFLQAVLMLVKEIYSEFIEQEDLKSLSEDIVKIIVKSIFSENIYTILIFLVRIDNFDPDKDMRKKYNMLKGVKTSDFGIDPYLTMNDPAILIQEISKFRDVEIETSRELISNPTVQNLDLEDMTNMQFKEYIK